MSLQGEVPGVPLPQRQSPPTCTPSATITLWERTEQVWGVRVDRAQGHRLRLGWGQGSVPVPTPCPPGSGHSASDLVLCGSVGKAPLTASWPRQPREQAGFNCFFSSLVYDSIKSITQRVPVLLGSLPPPGSRSLGTRLCSL